MSLTLFSYFILSEAFQGLFFPEALKQNLFAFFATYGTSRW
jgi:hypothetical protein